MLAVSEWQGFWENREAVGLLCSGMVLCALIVVPTLIYYWYRIAKMRAETELKQSMIERGMSVADIERVLQAKTPEK